jgi:hypothetical protein
MANPSILFGIIRRFLGASNVTARLLVIHLKRGIKVTEGNPSGCARLLKGGPMGISTSLDVRMTPKTKPIHEVRLGYMKAAIWRNETDAGVRFNFTFSRLYKDGDQWKSTESFGRDDLLLLAKVADQTHSWICANQTQETGDGTRVPSSRPTDER